MAHFEISPLCNYNVAESLAELTRRALKRNGMERLWRTNRGNVYNLNGNYFPRLLLFLCICYSFVTPGIVLQSNRLTNFCLHYRQTASTFAGSEFV